MAESMREFIDISQKMLACLQAAGEEEHEKRRALLDHDMDRLEGLLQNQQALTMQLEMLEKRRVSAQEKAGFPGMKHGEILSAIHDDTDKQALSALFRDMAAAADKLKELNRACIDIAKMELRLMGSSVPGISGEEGLYSPGRRKGDKGLTGSSFDGKI